MKHLVGKVITKKVDFMGDQVEVKKLSVSEVMKIQEFVKKASKSSSEATQLDLLKNVIRIAVIGAEELTDADFDTFPIDALSTLSEEIMEYSGLGSKEAGN